MDIQHVHEYLAGRRKCYWCPPPVRASLAGPLRPLMQAARHARSRWTARRTRRRQPANSRVVVDVPEFGGHFEFDSRGHLLPRVLSGRFESRLATFLRSVLQSGDDAIDIGANIGLFTVLMAKTVVSGKILAVEPSPHAYELLCENLTTNGIHNVIVFHGAATSEDQVVRLHHIPGFAEYSSLAGITHPSAPASNQQTLEVDGKPLDEIVARHNLRPALLKMDVEGAEGRVLEGGHGVLDEFRPAIISELDARLLPNVASTAEGVCELLAAHRYRVFDFATGKLLAKPVGFVGEILAVPEERAPKEV